MTDGSQARLVRSADPPTSPCRAGDEVRCGCGSLRAPVVVLTAVNADRRRLLIMKMVVMVTNQPRGEAR